MSRLAGTGGAAESALMHERTHAMRLRRDHYGCRSVRFVHTEILPTNSSLVWGTLSILCVTTRRKAAKETVIHQPLPVVGDIVATQKYAFIALETARFALEARDSAIHRYGVFAAERIPAGQRVIEYTGERISYAEAARRSERPYLYLFWLTPGLLIDGAVGGSGAEYINHSCEPNLEANVTDGHVYFVSLRDIAPDEELLLDYKVRGGAPEMRCRCGARSCRGFLNVA